MSADILALLDYECRAHEIEIRPASVTRPSDCVTSIMSKPIAWISYNLAVASHLPYPGYFLNVQKMLKCFFFFEYVSVSLTSAYGSKNFKTLYLLQISATKFSNLS